MSGNAVLVRRFYFRLPQIQKRHLITSSKRSTSTSPQRQQTALASEKNLKRFSDIPGPLALPMLRHSELILPKIGNFHHAVCLDLLEHLRDRYGNLVRLSKGSRKRPVLYVFDPEHMRQVYESDSTVVPRWDDSPLQKHRELRSSQCSLHDETTRQVWLSLRDLLQESSFLNTYNDAFDNIAFDVRRRFEDLKHDGKAFNENLEIEMYRWSLESLGVLLFGKRIGCLDVEDNTNNERLAEKLVRTSSEIVDEGYQVRSEKTMKVSGKTFENALLAYDQHFSLVEEILNNSLKDLDSGEERSEMLLLKSLRPLSSQLLPLVADALLAGVGPLSHSALAMFYHLSLHAARQQRAKDEVAWRSVADDAGAERPVELPYIGACVRETLRLQPATGGIVRRTKEQICLDGYEVPVGIDIVLAHGVSSRSEKQWGRAKTFVPERWHSQGWEPISANKAHPIATMPFGTNCPAERIAGKMLSGLASRIFEEFRLEWHGPLPKITNNGVNRLQPPYYFVLEKAV